MEIDVFLFDEELDIIQQLEKTPNGITVPTRNRTYRMLSELKRRGYCQELSSVSPPTFVISDKGRSLLGYLRASEQKQHCERVFQILLTIIGAIASAILCALANRFF